MSEEISTTSICNVAEYVLNRPLSQGAPIGFMNGFLYQVHLSMQNTLSAAIVLFIHNQFFQQEEIDRMTQQAVDHVSEHIIKDIRRHAKIEKDCDIKAMNLKYFPSYIQQFQHVMLDKYDFRALTPVTINAIMPQTILLKG